MEAGTLNCPMCGAPAATDSTVCEHCGARLAKVACPSCFGLIFEGAKFCSHCGAKIEPTGTGAADPIPCPHCRVSLEAVVIGQANVFECGKCEGVWVDKDTLRQICEDRDKQTAVLGIPSHLPPAAPIDGLEPIHYIPCPVCKELMNRVNFANCSHVIVNVCSVHGTWFDRDELRKVIEFIRAGGMQQARSKELASLEFERSMLKMDQAAHTGTPLFSTTHTNYRDYQFVFGLIGEAIQALLK